MNLHDILCASLTDAIMRGKYYYATCHETCRRTINY